MIGILFVLKLERLKVKSTFDYFIFASIDFFSSYSYFYDDLELKVDLLLQEPLIVQ